ncbi:unnamed protein product [Rhizophagus irregularis]|nr:unnamed protein product [Rhizophagus irregularis]
MYNLEKSLPPPPPPISRVQRHAQRLLQEQREMRKQMTKEMQEGHILHGISMTRYFHRKEVTDYLTKQNVIHYDESKSLISAIENATDDEQRSALVREYKDFNATFSYYLRNNVADIYKKAYRPPGTLEETSDDTKCLELHPRKRESSQQATNFFSNRNDDTLKRRRTYPAPADDSSDAGPLSLKFNA